MFGKKEVDVLNACVNAKIRMESNEEEMDMCEAFRQMIEEATEQAIAALGISEAEGEKLVRRL